MTGLNAAWFAGKAPKSPGSTHHRCGQPLVDGRLLAKSILIIEDEAMIAWALESMFSDMGFMSITLAATGEGAVAAATSLPPGLIVADINLGAGLDGISAVAAIASRSPVPVIFVTAYASENARVQIESLFSEAMILPKPLQPKALRQAVISIQREPNVQ